MDRDGQDKEKAKTNLLSNAFVFLPAFSFHPDHLCPSLLDSAFD
jgi:hypothetical protein